MSGQKANPKSKTAALKSPFSLHLVGGFCDELESIMEKVGNILPPPQTGLAQIKSTVPTPAGAVKGRHATVAKSHTTPPTSPLQAGSTVGA